MTLARDDRKRARRERQVERVRRELETKLAEAHAERDIYKQALLQAVTWKGALRTLWYRVSRRKHEREG